MRTITRLAVHLENLRIQYAHLDTTLATHLAAFDDLPTELRSYVQVQPADLADARRCRHLAILGHRYLVTASPTTHRGFPAYAIAVHRVVAAAHPLLHDQAHEVGRLILEHDDRLHHDDGRQTVASLPVAVVAMAAADLAGTTPAPAHRAG